jgi:hypothetical protein
MTAFLALLMAGFGFVAADRWIATARAAGGSRPIDERLVLVVVSASAALTALVAGP